MVCKEDVVTWFKELTSHKRIDVMCSLLNMCLPFELRFLGTCLEDLGKRDFHDLREVENRANNLSELADLQCISDKLTQRKLALYLSLLHSCNQACSNGLYKILANFDFGEINTLTNNSSEENPLDELLLLYTLALNHPAFTYEQKINFGNILVKLQDEENKMYAAKHPVGIGLVYVKPPIQPCVPCPSSDERQQQDVGVLGHCSSMTLPPSHSAAADMKGRTLPPGIAIPPGLPLPPEQQLTATSYLHVTFPSPGHQPLPSVPWHSGIGPLMMTSLCGTLPGEVQQAAVGGEISPYPSSPLMSRQSSPSQSGSPSRASSPARMQQQISLDRSQGYKGPPPSTTSRRGERLRQNCVDTSIAPPLQQRNISRKSSTEPVDPLRETLGKEMPIYVPNLQNYSAEELRRMCDEELKELGLTPGAIHQLRTIVVNLNSTNGMCSLDKRDSAPANTRRKQDSTENEVVERKTQSAGPVMRRYTGLPVEGAPMMYPPPPLLSAPPTGPCYTCIAVPVSSAAPVRYQGQAQQFYCVNHNMRALRLDGEGSRSSSASDSSSTSHSPPDTPSMATAPHWDRGYVTKETNVGERWSPGCEERLDKERRLPEPSEKTVGVEEGNSLPQQQQQTVHSSAMSNNNNNNNSRPRLLGGLGRSKTNPPGLQTLPRGRGPNPATVILEGNHKNLPSCRRDGPAINGSQVPPRTSHPPPTPQHEERKMFLVPSEMVHVSPHVTYSTVNSTSQPPPPQYTGGNNGNNPPPRPGDMSAGSGNVPYSPATATAFLPHAHFPALRSTGSIFPSFAPSSYMRPTFPFSPNGELVYQYHGPQTPPPPQALFPTPMVTYSTVVPPPKLSCYNCGSQSHHASDCKDPTMEEMTKPGQYRLDYVPYQKPGECSTEK